MSEKKSLLDLLPKGQLFSLGVVVSFVTITSFGFFFLLFRFVL